MPKADNIELALSGAFSIRQGRIERLISLLHPLFSLDEPAVILIDMRRVVSVSPAAVALLTAALARVVDLELAQPGSLIYPPTAAPVRNYLLRMDAVQPWLGEDFAEPFTRREPHGFRPCLHFAGADDYASVALALTNALTERCETDDIARASIRICLDEIAENVVHHADAPSGGFGAAQGWRKNQEFEIAMVDLGIGVRASLTQNPDHADVNDDVTAITRALQPRITATPERNAGIGLFITKLLLEANGGLLLVRSGYGSVYAGGVDQARMESFVMPGTLVALRARTDRALNILSVYEDLERDHPDGNGDD